MIGRVPWPRSLASQIALLIAMALLAAQLVNFAMIYQGRNQLRLQTVVAPAVTRYVDTVERLAHGTLPDQDPRARAQLRADNPVDPRGPHRPEIERAIIAGLQETGVGPVQVQTEVRPINANDPRIRHFGRHRSAHFLRMGAELIVAMQIPGRGWLVMTTPWPRSDSGIVSHLLAQTLILYAIILIPVLWGARQISRPLQQLAKAAREFRPGQDNVEIIERGPPDVRAVIGAYNALRLRVTAMLEEKDRMLGAIGHDLRTPLAALRVRIESVDDESDRARMIDTIEELNRTLDDILSLARLGRPSEAKVDVDLAALVDAVVEDFRDIGSNVAFAESDRLTMQLRPSLMRRAVRNLIENAVKYAGAASVSLDRTADTATIIITDNGPGIPEAQMQAVFDPFTRLETSRNRDTGGIGLGLALAQAIVREAGGQITIANRPEGGLAAKITLPRSIGN